MPLVVLMDVAAQANHDHLCFQPGQRFNVVSNRGNDLRIPTVVKTHCSIRGSQQNHWWCHHLGPCVFPVKVPLFIQVTPKWKIGEMDQSKAETLWRSHTSRVLNFCWEPSLGPTRRTTWASTPSPSETTSIMSHEPQTLWDWCSSQLCPWSW